MDAEIGADQRPEHDDGERAEQRVRQRPLMPRLTARDHRRQEDAGGDERRRDPEQRKLDVPGAHEVVREPLREIDPEEVVDLRAVVLRRRADQRLQQEQRGHHEEEPRARALRRRERDVAGRPERQRRLLAPVPAEPPAPAAERAEQQADAAQQRDQRQHGPHEHIGRRRVVDARLRRPVVRIRVVVPGTVRRRRPRRPGEERRQLPQPHGIGDRVRAQPVHGPRIREEAAVVRHERPVRGRLRGGEAQPPGALVVAVGTEVGDRLARGVAGCRPAVRPDRKVGRTAQVVGGEVRAEVGAVSERRPVLHQAVVQEDLLARRDVTPGEDHATLWVDHGARHRGVRRVGPVGEQAEDEEPAQDDQDRGLDPALRDQ